MATNFIYDADINLIAMTEATKELLYYWKHNMLERPCLQGEEPLEMYKYLCKNIPQKIFTLKFLLMIPDTNIRKMLNFEPDKYTSLDEGKEFWKQILAPDHLETLEDFADQQTKEVTERQNTKRIDISVHFEQVSSHRAYVQFVAKLFEIAATMDHYRHKELYHEFYKDWEVSGGKTKIIEHDLCKIDPHELFGYFMQWGLTEECNETNKLVQVKQQVSEWTEIMWKNALKHHYITSSHHPEYYEGGYMRNVDLCESVIDMLACNLQRSLCEETEVSAADMVLISPRFLKRYNEHDRKLVIRLLCLFGKALDRIILAVSLLPIDQSIEMDNYRYVLWEKEALLKGLKVIRGRRLMLITNSRKFTQNDSLKSMWENFLSENEDI